MTAYRFVTITCDRCGEIYEGGQDTKVSQARSGAAREGWRYERRRDLCPRCKNAALKWPERESSNSRDATEPKDGAQ